MEMEAGSVVESGMYAERRIFSFSTEIGQGMSVTVYFSLSLSVILYILILSSTAQGKLIIALICV